MDFRLTKEQELSRDLFRDFAEKEVKPLAKEIDEQERFPMETYEKLAKLGFLGIPFPEKFGGQGSDYLTYILCIEELSRVCASTGIFVETHTSLGTEPIFDHGTDAQIQKYAVPLAQGKIVGAFALTEPSAGTDASAQQTKAELKGDHYVINGSKIFISNSGVASTYIVMAMTDKSKGTKGISAFIVEKDFPGFRVGAKEHKMGIRGSATCELIFEDCIVPKENLLGQEGKGFNIAMQGLDGGRLGVGAQALGIAQGALDEAIKYTQSRIQFGKPISSFQNTQFVIADLATEIDAARLLVYRGCVMKDQGQRYSKEAAMAKLFAAQTAMNVTTKCVQLFGGYGYTREYPVERMMRDAKITEIYEGTSEVQRMVIASNVIK